MVYLPQDWVRKTYGYDAVDEPIVYGLRYIGSEDSATYEAAATTNDFTFKHGASGSEVADSTVGSSGVLDLTTFDTVHKLIRAVNASPNWEAWPVDYLPDADTNISAGNGIFGTISATQAKVDDGVLVPADTSLETAEFFPVGVTFYGSSINPHNKDANVLHEVLGITANITFGGATDGIYVYEVDDINGTKTEIDHLALASATATSWSNSGEPLYSVKGKRIVFKAADASGAISSPLLTVSVRSLPFGPAVRKSKLLSEY